MELTKRAARTLEKFIDAGHGGVYCTGDLVVGSLLELGLVERVECDRYRATKRGRALAPRVRVVPPATEEARVAELLESCDGSGSYAFGHPTYRAEGGHLVCLTCGAPFSPVAPYLPRSAQAALRRAGRPERWPRPRGSSLEAAGAAVLSAPPREAPRSATMGVRFYFESLGSELLSFDAGPLSPDAARTLLDRYTEARYEVVAPGAGEGGRDVWGYVRRPTGGAVGAELITWRDRQPAANQIFEAYAARCAVPDGARGVVLPSQVPDADAYQRIEDGPGTSPDSAHAQLALFDEAAP
jgi:hypothetical protein